MDIKINRYGAYTERKKRIERGRERERQIL